MTGAPVPLLRIKRKRTDDPVIALLAIPDDPTDLDDSPTKRRRVWQLSGPTPATSSTLTQTEVPRFALRKRKSLSEENSTLILDLERQESVHTASGPRSYDRPTRLRRTAGHVDDHLAPNAAHMALVDEFLAGDAASTGTSIHSSTSDEEWVYDLYYPVETVDALCSAQDALRSNYGLLEHFELSGSIEADGDGLEPEDDHDSEDSNAESWQGNDYPDEEEFDTSDEEDVIGSDSSERYSDDEYGFDHDLDEDF
ncbi:hypothetical protein PYCC9005_003759 [Savitreella phatthalungensis]